MSQNNIVSKTDVIDAVCRHLEAVGWTIKRSSPSGPQADIIAIKDGQEQHVQACGEGSEKEALKFNSAPFDSSRSKHHIAYALFNVLSYRSQDRCVGIALADTLFHRERMAQLGPLPGLGVLLYWVPLEGELEEDWL